MGMAHSHSFRSRRLHFESLEGRQLLASLWQNPGQALDINRDLIVDRRDLDTILAAQRQMYKPLAARAADSTAPYYDASGDGRFDWSDYALVNTAVALKKPIVAAESTGEAAVFGRVTNWTSSDRLQARVDGRPWTDISSLISNKAFALDAAKLATIARSPLAAGQHVLELRILRSGKAAGVGMDLILRIQGEAVNPPIGGSSDDPLQRVVDPPVTVSSPPGTVIDFQPASTKQYIGSPSIAILPNGDYVASHDLFGPNSTSDTTEVFLSRDRGQSWQQLTTLRGQVWSTLFVHEGQLYLLGTDRFNGAVVIRRSSDGGAAWTTPSNATTGRLLSGQYATGPTPVIVSGGRIWRSMEAVGSGGWGMNFQPFVMSAPVGADLLNAASWTSSNRIVPQASWLGGQFGGFLEGNMVVAPDGGIVNILRVHTTSYPERAALIHVSADGKKATFNPAADFISFPGGTKKFTIRFDDVSQRYWSLTNDVPQQFRGQAAIERTRNTLSLISSADLRTWRIERVVLQDANVSKSGFQYADWQFDGEDLIAAIRTSFREPSGALAASSHDSNFLTFFRVKSFRGV
jgi:hypothetical protein